MAAVSQRESGNRDGCDTVLRRRAYPAGQPRLRAALAVMVDLLVKTDAAAAILRLSGVPNPNPRHNRHRADRRWHVKHDLLDFRLPTNLVP